MKNTIKKTFISIITATVLTACASVPKEIPESLTAQELIQKGQDNFEIANYAAALCYYNAVTERYSDVLPVYIEASYEIGHIYMKQKDYQKASVIFDEIIGIYSQTAPGVLPGAYEKLARLEKAKIPQE